MISAIQTMRCIANHTANGRIHAFCSLYVQQLLLQLLVYRNMANLFKRKPTNTPGFSIIPRVHQSIRPVQLQLHTHLSVE